MTLEKFKTIEAHDFARLAEAVEAAAADGYVPYGAWQFVNGRFYIAMVIGDVAGAPVLNLDASALAGATEFGVSLLSAEDAEAAGVLIGATTVGAAVLTAEDGEAARTAIGAPGVGEAVEDAGDDDVKDQLNALLASLRASGAIATGE